MLILSGVLGHARCMAQHSALWADSVLHALISDALYHYRTIVVTDF
ncbi:MAG: hypothetical protein R2818_03945 [Flavobacteriales bacterium]